MLLYHFSDGEYNVGDMMPIGNYGKYVTSASATVKRFENLMEISRIKIDPRLSSRLNCIFAFNQEYADGFKCDRKYLYELEVPESILIFEHNYNVSTFFWNLCNQNRLSDIEKETDLMDDYWRNDGTFLTTEPKIIPYDKEFLISQPVKIIRKL